MEIPKVFSIFVDRSWVSGLLPFTASTGGPFADRAAEKTFGDWRMTGINVFIVSYDGV